ncbi:MAG: L,D-transpeptidase Cds6 family protein [Rhodoferax sp.]
MKHFRLPAWHRYAALLVLATSFSLPVWADDYSDVMQLMRQGKTADALAKADQYLSSKPKDAQMRFLKGVILRDAGKTADALATFTKLTEDYPELPEPYNNLAVLYASQGQYDKARAALEMAIRTNPSYSTAHENLGDVYAKLASQAYNKALQLDSGNTAVPPKLALIRELFNPAGPRTAPAAAPAATSAAKPAPAAVPAPKEPAAASATTSTPAPHAAATAPAPKEAAAAPKETAASNGNAVKDVQQAVQTWAAAWSARDMNTYLAAYGKEFDPPGNMSRNAWEEERRARITGKSSISVRVDKLDVSVNGTSAVAKFRQHYSANGLSVSSRKTLEMRRAGERWVIVRESTGS